MESRTCPVCLQNSEFTNFAYHTNPNIPSGKIGLFSKLRIEVCVACGTGQASPACSSEELRDFYSGLFATASTKSGLFKKGLYARTAHQFLTFKDFINIKNSSVIEIGSHDTGWFTLCEMYRAKSYSYFDAISSSYIDNRGGRFLGFLNANSLSAVDPSSIDLVVASHSLEHLIPEEIRELLNSINRILKPQTGKLFIEIPLELEYFDSPTLMPPHTLFFTQNGLINLLENFGYDLVTHYLRQLRE